MANDYISRKEAVDKITALINKSGKYTAYESGADDACYIVEHEIPAADVRPVVRAKWVRGNENRTSPIKDSYTCSVCGEKTLSGFCGNPAKTNFCPNCGADMREVKADG